MDKKVVKIIITTLREEGKTYQEISDVLDKEFGVKMSRQAVCGMYNRLMNKDRDTSMSEIDICKYASIGVSIDDIRNLLKSNDVNISTPDIVRILLKNREYLDELKCVLVKELIEHIKKGKDIEYIRASLEYKGVMPVDKVLYELLDLAATEVLKSRAVDLMVKLVNMTDNRELAKRVASKHNFNVTCKELNEALNR